MTKTSRAIRESAKQGIKGPSIKGEHQVCCPFCAAVAGKPDTKFKLQLNASKGVYYCYKCQSSGRADLTWIGEQKIEVSAAEAYIPNVGPPEGYLPLAGNSAQALKPYHEYLHERFPYAEGRGHIINRLQIGACLHGRFAGRIIIPHLRGDPASARGQWQGFAARAIYPSMKTKYLYPLGMKRSELVWGTNEEWSAVNYIVEGVFDALAIYPHGVATYGKNVTEQQLDIISNLHSNIVVCLDGDAWEECQALAARIMLRRMDEESRGMPSVRWCRLPPGEDPGKLGWKIRDFIVA